MPYDGRGGEGVTGRMHRPFWADFILGFPRIMLKLGAT